MTPIAIHYQPILHFISKRVQNSADAEDLTQEVFYKLINSNNKGAEIQNTQSWLYTIARNTLTDYYRKKKVVFEAIESNSFVELPIANEELLLDSDQRTRLRTYLCSLIDDLPADYQQIIRMSELEGMSQKEIAEELNLNYTTVRSKVQRGRAKLKAKISECCEVIQGGKGSIIGYRPAAKSTCGSSCKA